MIDTTGMITVAEAAKRLDLSIEQVRRKLREGKLKGQRIGNQWFVEEEAVVRDRGADEDRLVPRDLLDEIDRTREAIFRRNGITFDAVALVNEVREEDFGEREDLD
jgi:excisionase family DNA binding protein